MDISKIRRTLISARKHNVKAALLENELFSELRCMDIELGEIGTGAPNATNLEEAITCFISYGEYELEELMGEIKQAIKSSKLNFSKERNGKNGYKNND